MFGPTKNRRNRLHDYEAGWLTLLVEMAVASNDDAQAAPVRLVRLRVTKRTAAIPWQGYLDAGEWCHHGGPIKSP